MLEKSENKRKRGWGYPILNKHSAWQCDQKQVLDSVKFGHLWQWKIAQTNKIFAKVGSQFCQILNIYSRIGQKLYKNFA